MATPALPAYSGRPPKWRVLGVLTGPTADALVEGDERGLGAIEEIFSLPGTEAEVHVIKYPRLEDLSAQLQGWKPNFVYVYGGVNGDKKDLEKQTVSHLSFLVDSQGRFVEAALRLFLASFGGLHLDTVYFDAMGCTQIGEALHAAGVPNVLVWPQETLPLCLPAMHFAHAFFCMLRNRSVTVPEAFAMATHMSKAHCPQPTGAEVPRSEYLLPRLLSRAPSVLPGIASVPPFILGGKDVSSAMVTAAPGYDQVRLLAPNAELRMLACGLSGFINSQSLVFLGESLRALLTTEVRRLTVQRLIPCEKTPKHLPPNCSAVRCELVSFSGAPITVVLGGPLELLQNQMVVEYALRQTMVADAHSLQFKLPPPNVPLPASRTNLAVANGAPVVEALLVTSVWCVQLLKVLCQDLSYRGLVALGVGAISNSPVVSFTKADANRYSIVVTNNDATKLLQAPTQADGSPAAATNGTPGIGHVSPTEESEAPLPTPAFGAGLAAGGAFGSAGGFTAAALAPGSLPRPASVGGSAAGVTPMAALPRSGSFGLQLNVPGSSAQAGSSAMGSQFDRRGRSESPELTSGGSQNPIRIRQHMQVPPWRSSRPPIKQCTEDQFMSDLIAFLTDRQGRQIDPKNFPEAILNGSRLDLFNLYKEVCNRGGYQVGNGINWKGQVFPRMRNYTAQHKMTGVGNALKRHYQMFLLEYEHAHPEDVNGGQCALCGQGEEYGTDWISCDMCDCWVHFSCDKRPFLGSFKEYSRGRTRTYCCPRCYEIKRQRSMQQQQQQVEVASAAAAPTTTAGAMELQQVEELPPVKAEEVPASDQPMPMETAVAAGPAMPLGQLQPVAAAAPPAPASQQLQAQPVPLLVRESVPPVVSGMHPSLPAMPQVLPVPQLMQSIPGQPAAATATAPANMLVSQAMPFRIPAITQPQPHLLASQSMPSLPPGLPSQPPMQQQEAAQTLQQPQPQQLPAAPVPQVQVAAPQFHITVAAPQAQQQSSSSAALGAQPV